MTSRRCAEPDKVYAQRWKQMQRAVAAFDEADCAEALALLPDPGEQKDPWNRRREWLMLSRMHARLGHASAAREALQTAKREPP